MRKPRRSDDFSIENATRDYLTPLDTDDDRIRDAKERIMALKPAERRILLTYIDFGTYSETAREFNVSSTCIRNYINEIRRKINAL